MLDDPEVGLNEGGFYLKSSSEGFLRALFVVAGMDMALADQRIRRIRNYLEEEGAACKPYIWADAGSWRFMVDRQMGRAQCRIREHVDETRGDLGIWGSIKQYWFFYKRYAAYLLTLNGEVIDKHKGPISSKAILPVNCRSPYLNPTP